jgi:RNA polymerase sigma-70 factor (ECF subfamily)
VTELERLCRAEWGRLLAALIRAFQDFDLCEESLQEAFASAALEWGQAVPHNPRAWLYGTARHKAIDAIRRGARQARLHERAAQDAQDTQTPPEPPDEQGAEEGTVPEERLRLIFTCCHPALAVEAQVALTLRTLGGLTTEQIARAFLLPTTTMAQRLVRAKAKIRDAGVPYVVPAAEDLPERLGAVAEVLYLIFNEGYAAAQGQALVRRELCAEAIELGRLLRQLLPGPAPAIDALLALMLLHDSRRATRADAAGDLVLLADQDRTRWDRAQIEEGCQLLRGALTQAPPGTFALEAAIAAVHAEAATAADTDWRQIVGLYDRLLRLHPSPVVALNRAVAVAMADGPAQALPLLQGLAEPLGGYHLWHSARADLLRQLGRPDEARAAYQQALERAENEPERRFLQRRLALIS